MECYGTSKYNDGYPTLSYRKPDYFLEDATGEYVPEENHIYINKIMCNTFEELAKTVIHEYQHYMQNTDHFQIVSMYVKRERNPFEIEAEKIAKKDYKKCLTKLGYDNK
jgi:Zn-dependent peptidase ImmA (M78 family)